MANALADLVVAYGVARRKVMAAQTREKFLEASADLWEAEQALAVTAERLQREKGGD